MSDEAKNKTIPLKRVTLYKHGIGYFERRGRLKGPAEVELLCGPDEIDDMLKSLMVLNLEGGRVSAITYESAKRIEDRLAEFGFDLRRCKGMLDLIGQIKGAPISVSAHGETTSGRVVGLDEVEQAVGETKIKEHQLVLYSDNASLRRISVSAIQKLSVDDQSLASELQQQLELLFQSVRKKDQKLLTVELEEEIDREVIIAYSIPCPIWKTSYRLLVNEEGRLLIQGMAIVDNIQEEDWDTVQMVLISAAPISFIQPLYEPVKPWRKTIQPQGINSTGPFTAERGQAEAFFDSATQDKFGMSDARAIMGYGSLGAMAPAAPQAPGAAGGAGWGAPAQGPMPLQQSIASANFETAAREELDIETQEAGEMFEYRISTPVTVPRNSSALIPIVQQITEGERISIYNESRNTKFPYSAVRLKNTTGLTLESGPVTIMDNDAYAGEALLDVLKNGDTRILPFALDQGLHVITRENYERKPIWRVRTWHGFLHMDYKEQNKKTYQMENLTDKEKIVYVEHPIRSGLKIVSDHKPEESTESYHRLKVLVGAKENKALEVVEEWDGSTQVRLQDYDSAEMPDINWLLDQNILDKKFVELLREILTRRQAVRSVLEKQRELKERIQQYTADQERARENVRTLGTTSDRYRKAIDEAEDQIAKASAQLQALNQELQGRKNEYNELIRQNFVSEIEAAASKKR